MLIRRDGFDPWALDSASHLHGSAQSSKVIAPLLGVSERDADIAVKDMKKYAVFFYDDKSCNPRRRVFSFSRSVDCQRTSAVCSSIRQIILNAKKCSLVLGQKLEGGSSDCSGSNR